MLIWLFSILPPTATSPGAITIGCAAHGSITAAAIKKPNAATAVHPGRIIFA